MARLPRGENSETIPLTPSKIALATTVSGSLSDGSTAHTINALTTFLRVYATVQDVYLKWGATTVTSSNFDEIIPAGQIVDLVVPIDSSVTPPSRFAAYRIIERTTAASIVIIEK